MISIVGCRILQKIGEGALGVVYKARVLSRGQDVAVKVLKGPYSEYDPSATRFNLQASAIEHLRHPHLVEVYEQGDSEGTRYFLMAFVDGYSLAEWMQRKGRIAEAEALLLIRSVAEGLRYAWEVDGLIHGDIKPTNILIDGDGTVKVGDFSGLRRGVSGPLWQTLAQSGIGAPGYMSPEQARGIDELDFRADVYSLGALLYHMLTGKEPFAEKDRNAAIHAHIHERLDDPRAYNPRLSLGVCRLIRRMMAKNAGDRHAQWGAVLEDLNRVSLGRSLAALPPGVASTVRSFSDHAGGALEAIPSGTMPEAMANLAARGHREPPRRRQPAYGLNKLVFVAITLLALNIAALMNPHWMQSLRWTVSGWLSAESGNEPGDSPDTALAGGSGIPGNGNGDVPAIPQRPANDVEVPVIGVPSGTLQAAPSPDGERDGAAASAARATALVEYLLVMTPVLAQSHARQYELAMREVIAWIEENPGHPYRAQLAREVRRLSSAKAVFDRIESRRDRLVGQALTGGERMVGEVKALGGGRITVRRRLGAGEAEQIFALRELPDRDLSLLLHLAEPEVYHERYAVLMISQGRYAEALAVIARAERAVQDVDGLHAWVKDWQALELNIAAYRSLRAIREAVDSGKADWAAQHLTQARQRYAETDVFRWTLRDEVQRLQGEILDLRRNGSGQGTVDPSTGTAGVTRLESMSVQEVSVEDLNTRIEAYDGQVVHLAFRCRSRVVPVPGGMDQIQLLDREYEVNAHYPPEAEKWVNGVTLWNMEAPLQRVYGRVDAAKAVLVLLGNSREASGQSAVYRWR